MRLATNDFVKQIIKSFSLFKCISHVPTVSMIENIKAASIPKLTIVLLQKNEESNHWFSKVCRKESLLSKHMKVTYKYKLFESLVKKTTSLVDIRNQKGMQEMTQSKPTHESNRDQSLSSMETTLIFNQTFLHQSMKTFPQHREFVVLLTLYHVI